MDMGNFGFPNMNVGFPNMNFGFPNENKTSSEDSDSDTHYCYGENSESETSSMCDNDSDTSSDDKGDATVDSVIKVPKKKYHSCFEITFEDVNEIEVALDLYELISLIFLLFDNTSYAVQVIRSLIAAGPENFSRGKLSEWARTSPNNWKYKMLEALAIIQNYNILINLGLCKEDINVMSDAPLYINRFKKVIFSSVCDCLKKEQAQELINRVRCHAKFKDDITLNYDPMYIEFHILFWISQGYINIEREPYLENLTRHLNDTIFLHVFKKVNEEVTLWRKNTLRKSDEFTIKTFDDEGCYKIKDPKNPGLVVVINNANFAKNIEKREEFQCKLPNSPLPDRKGSETDEKNLKKTFEFLNYKVVVRNDISHDKLVDDIYCTVRDHFEVGRHSVLVLCVLSHGDEGVVFGANGVPLKKEEIINSVSGSSRLIGLLADTPKVIIIQACQGRNVLYVEPEPDLLVPDGAGPGSPVVADGDTIKVDGLGSFDPRDKVVCMATIKGFVAFRSLANGSPYIQELCRYIKKYHSEEHFIDIMTRVHRKLSREKCIVKQVHEQRPLCMIPEISENTLLKSLYLTPKGSISRHRHSVWHPTQCMLSN